MSFRFARTETAERFCTRIVESLQLFCGKSTEEAHELVKAYWSDVDDIESDALLYSEAPYYYAQCIAHHPVLGDGKRDWHKDPLFWPPPAGWERI